MILPMKSNLIDLPTSDWTVGGHLLHFQSCKICSHVWYFHRSFCPNCGDTSPLTAPTNGRGVIFTQTLVHRAPDAKFKELAPYNIVLVDLEEGFRVMAHGDKNLAIGDSVLLSFISHAEQQIPYFKKYET